MSKSRMISIKSVPVPISLSVVVAIVRHVMLHCRNHPPTTSVGIVFFVGGATTVKARSSRRWCTLWGVAIVVIIIIVVAISVVKAVDPLIRVSCSTDSKQWKVH